MQMKKENQPQFQEHNEIKGLLEKALVRLYDEDVALFQLNAHEQALVFRFGLYFQELINSSRFKELTLDMEYNKHGENKKILPSRLKGIRPDIILHERENDENNILAIEFKKFETTNFESDYEKLKELTNPNGDYKYKLGVFIQLKLLRHEMIYFINGVNYG